MHEQKSYLAPPEADAGEGGSAQVPPESLDALNFVDYKANDKVTIKEADVIKLAALPEVAQFVNWKQQVPGKVVSASGRGDEAFAWIRQA